MARTVGLSLVLGQSPPPTVTITSPANNSYFTSGDPIVLSADASAPGGTVQEVAFYNQYSGALLALVTNAPWSATIFITNALHTELPGGRGCILGTPL